MVLQFMKMSKSCDFSPETPSVKELECILYSGKSYMNHVDEVWPNLFLGDMQLTAWIRTVNRKKFRNILGCAAYNLCPDGVIKNSVFNLHQYVWVPSGTFGCMAHDRHGLWKLGITHVLNAAHGKAHCQGSHAFYGSAMEYHGVPANDLPTFDISPYFYPSADYIHKVLSTPGARIFVHCAVGVSRSASLVLAYLMIYHHLTLLDAIKKVKENRWIFPNRGFLKHLRTLDLALRKCD